MHVHYRPAPQVLDHLNSVDFVGVVGPTASGKTTLLKAALQREPRLRRVPSSTSRAPRPGERDGVDFRFLSKEVMQERIQRSEYVQVAPAVLGDLYATAPEDYATDGIAILEVLAAAVPVFRGLPFKSVRTIYVVPPSWDEWQQRIAAHQFTPEQRQKRLAEARQSLQFALHDEHTQFVINQDTSTATADLIALVHSAPPSARLQADQSRARAIVRRLLQKLA
jgi:guanylate kinase